MSDAPNNWQTVPKGMDGYMMDAFEAEMRRQGIALDEDSPPIFPVPLFLAILAAAPPPPSEEEHMQAEPRDIIANALSDKLMQTRRRCQGHADLVIEALRVAGYRIIKLNPPRDRPPLTFDEPA